MFSGSVSAGASIGSVGVGVSSVGVSVVVVLAALLLACFAPKWFEGVGVVSQKLDYSLLGVSPRK